MYMTVLNASSRFTNWTIGHLYTSYFVPLISANSHTSNYHYSFSTTIFCSEPWMMLAHPEASKRAATLEHSEIFSFLEII